MYSTKLPYLLNEADRKDLTTGPDWEPDEVQHVMDRIRAGDLTPFSVPPVIPLQAIDPATGDSVLHIATQLASPLDAIKKIMAMILGKDRFANWATHSLLTHQNYSGDTVLYVAARSGNQNLLTMFYRYTTDHWSAEYPEVVVMDDGPPENDVYPDDTDHDAQLTLSHHEEQYGA